MGGNTNVVPGLAGAVVRGRNWPDVVPRRRANGHPTRRTSGDRDGRPAIRSWVVAPPTARRTLPRPVDDAVARNGPRSGRVCRGAHTAGARGRAGDQIAALARRQ